MGGRTAAEPHSGPALFGVALIAKLNAPRDRHGSLFTSAGAAGRAGHSLTVSYSGLAAIAIPLYGTGIAFGVVTLVSLPQVALLECISAGPNGRRKKIAVEAAS